MDENKKKNDDAKVKKKDMNDINNEDKKVVENVDEKNYVEKLNEDLEEQRKKSQEYLDSLQRNMAEFDNYKKRMSKERDSLYISVVCEVAEKLLPIIDNFEKAANAECTDKAYKDGITMIGQSLQDILKVYMIEPIEDIGQTFNPEYHEAVLSCTDDTKGEKEIVEVFRKGYKIKEKVVRHSLVKVAN